ncbi:hypothetical protein, partial [Mesorhizobium sp. M4B.F.Ca.ET.211.01.1.1]|uniref:hypothetical protein n=1 Tax=Mesorhizobium sp. M4B.F.Ca.ET.211.01.1.1 TaxID=2563954 RepID=UPI001AEEAF94
RHSRVVAERHLSTRRLEATQRLAGRADDGNILGDELSVDFLLHRRLPASREHLDRYLEHNYHKMFTALK